MQKERNVDPEARLKDRSPQAQLIKTYLSEAEGKFIEKFVIMTIREIPLLVAIILLFGLATGRFEPIPAMLTMVLVHPLFNYYMALRAYLRNKNILRCDWLI